MLVGCMQVEPKGQNQIPTFYVKLSNSSGVDINEEVIKVTTNPPSKKVIDHSQEHIEPAREHVTPYMLVYTAKSKHG